MQLTYADREMVFQVFDRLKNSGDVDDRHLIREASKWAEQLRPGVGFETGLLADITNLCHYLVSSNQDEICEIARGALRYALLEDDLIPDSTPVLGLQDDAFVAGFALHEIRTRLGVPTTYRPPRLIESERRAAEQMFQSFRVAPPVSDEVLREAVVEFRTRSEKFAGSGFFGRLSRNVDFLQSIMDGNEASSEHRAMARAALCYLGRQDDVIDDSLGLVGYLDDNFVVQTAVDLIEPGRDPWLDVLDAITVAWPFVGRMVFGSGGNAYPLSEFLLIDAALTCPELQSDPLTRSTVVVPFTGPLPVILGFTAAIGFLHDDRSVHATPLFNKGDKVFVDNGSVATFDGFEAADGREHFWLKQGTTRRRWPIKLITRLTPAPTHRVTRGRIRHSREQNPMPVSALEHLFHLQAPIPFAQVEPRLIVVTNVSEAERFALSLQIHGQTLRDILPMGHRRTDGEFDIWSPKHAVDQPMVVFAPDLDRAAEIAEDCNNLGLILVDGSVARKSGGFARISSGNTPIVVLASEGDLDSLEFLEQQQFSFWEWDDGDFSQLFWPVPHAPDGVDASPLAHYESRIRRARKSQVKVSQISLPEADNAYAAIRELDRLAKLRESDTLEELNDLRALSFGLFFFLIHTCRQEGLQTDETLQRRQNEIQQILRKCLYFTKDERAAGAHVCQTLAALRSKLAERNPKAAALEKFLRDDTAAIAVCRDSRTADQFRQQLSVEQHRIIAAAECEEIDGPVVITGWFNRQRMTNLLQPPVGNPVTLLLYEVEASWFALARQRWEHHRSRRRRLSGRSKFFRDVEGWSRYEPVEIVPGSDEKLSSVPSPFDELIAVTMEARRRRLIEQARGNGFESELEARPAFFSDGSHAFFTDTYQAKVVTHLLQAAGKESENAEVQLVPVERLKPGDVLLFMRGSDRDVLRDIADRFLPRGTREIATLWRTALRRFMRQNGMTPRQVWAKLRAAGLKHHPSTVRFWLETDDVTGPRDAHTGVLEKIADATGDQEFRRKLNECDSAITSVWGAHLRASHYLAQQVLARVADRLADGVALSQLVEVESGVVLARLDELSEETVSVVRTATNRLLEGDPWRE